MEKMIYDLRQHNYLLTIYINTSNVYIQIYHTLNRTLQNTLIDFKDKATIIYDIQNTIFLNFNEEDSNYIKVDDLMNKLYCVYKKGEHNWEQNDKFIIEAFSEFIRLTINRAIKESKAEFKDLKAFHYAFIVPSEWEEEVRENLIRLAFIQANLISEDDHRDRLLFFSDLESICYGMKDLKSQRYPLKRDQNTILSRLTPIEVDEALIKLDLIQSVNTSFDFSNSMLYPKVMRSNPLIITSYEIKIQMKVFLENALQSCILSESSTSKEKTIVEAVSQAHLHEDENLDQLFEAMIEDLWNQNQLEKFNYAEFRKPIFKNIERWNLNMSQKKIIKALNIGDLCAIVGKALFKNMKDILVNNFVKVYRLLIFEDRYSSDIELNPNLAKWLRYILEYNMLSLNEITTINKITSNDAVSIFDVVAGVKLSAAEIIHNSNIHCPPRIWPAEKSIANSSLFLESEGNSIINIDIGFKTTAVSYSIFDSDGIIIKKFDTNYFTVDQILPSLETFYNFSNPTTLKVNKKYLLQDFRFFSRDEYNFSKIKAIITEDNYNEENSIFTQEKQSIQNFLLIYLVYLKELISKKSIGPTNFEDMSINIGYLVSIEKIILDKIIGNKEDLLHLILNSGLVTKDDHYRKLRIITQGEGLLPVIQQSLNLKYFPVKNISCDIPETIIVEEKFIAIPNIYDSICIYMWNILQQKASLLQLCDTHYQNNHHNFLDLFSLKTKNIFMKNLKQFISNYLFADSQNRLSTTKHCLLFSHFCSCKVWLSIADIINISLEPALQKITSIMLASLLNKEYFGNYYDIKSMFCWVLFNHNRSLQKIITNIMEEKAISFSAKRGIETRFMATPELINNHYLQPTLSMNSFLYHQFKVGSFHQIFSENYACSISWEEYEETEISYKNEKKETIKLVVTEDMAFPLLKKGNLMNNKVIQRVFYLKTPQKKLDDYINIVFYQYKNFNSLQSNTETLFVQKEFCEPISRPNIYLKDLFSDSYVPIMVSVTFLGFSSSLQFSVKLVGGVVDKKKNLFETGEPITLVQF